MRANVKLGAGLVQIRQCCSHTLRLEARIEMRLLLVEDEIERAQALSAALYRRDYIVEHVVNLAATAEAVRSDGHDATLLDWSPPIGEGVSLIPPARSFGREARSSC